MPPCRFKAYSSRHMLLLNVVDIAERSTSSAVFGRLTSCEKGRRRGREFHELFLSNVEQPITIV